MFKNETKNAMMAMAVVAMFMLSACAIIASPSLDADEYGTDTYTINMRANDTFAYNPKANIVGTTLNWSGTGLNATGMTHADGSMTDATTSTSTLSYAPTAQALNKQVILTASHSASGQSSITQTITFNVYDRMTVASDESLTVTPSNTNFAASAAIPSTSNVGTAFHFTADKGLNVKFTPGSATVKYSATENGTYANSNVFTVANNTTDNKVSISVASAPATGWYKISVPVGWETTSSGNAVQASESKTLDFTIQVTAGVTIVTDTAKAVIGQASNANVINLENDASGNTITFTPAISNKGSTATSLETALAGKITMTKTAVGKASLVVDASGLANSLIGNTGSEAITLKVTGTGTTGGTPSQNFTVAEKTITLTVYKFLQFTTAPTTAVTQVLGSSANGLDVLITANVGGAKTITYNWGDGTEYSKSITAAESAVDSASHTYAQPGTYFIKVTAANDVGETTQITPYTTGALILTSTDKVLKMTGIDAKTDGDNLTLTGKAIVTDGVTTSYKWTYTSGDIKDKVITNEDKPAWVVSVSGKTLVLTKADVPDNTKFVCEVSATFEGDTEATTSSASYIYNDANFFSQNPWALWIPIIVAAVLLVVMLFVTGFLPPMLIATGLAVIAQIVMLALRFFSII